MQFLTDKLPFHCVVSDAQVVIEISKGVRPYTERPVAEIVHEAEWMLMQMCCETDTGMRPSMQDVVERVREIRGKECEEDERREEGEGKEEGDGGKWVPLRKMSDVESKTKDADAQIA